MMRLYLGARDYKPPGYLTVDIDPEYAPDILADVIDMPVVESNSVQEVCASHILEHLPWPLGFKALAEWARVLKKGGVLRVGVPDLAALSAMLADGRNVWHAAGLLFGVGRLENPLEAHQYGYTRAMLTDMMRALGFSAFQWWQHDLPDASNGWMQDEAGGRIAISLNLSGTKLQDPIVAPTGLLDALMADRLAPFDQVLAKQVEREAGSTLDGPGTDPRVVQRVHMALIEARQRILFLEDRVRALEGQR